MWSKLKNVFSIVWKSFFPGGLSGWIFPRGFLIRKRKPQWKVGKCNKNDCLRTFQTDKSGVIQVLRSVPGGGLAKNFENRTVPSGWEKGGQVKFSNLKIASIFIFTSFWYDKVDIFYWFKIANAKTRLRLHFICATIRVYVLWTRKLTLPIILVHSS